tara:strand:+ start:1445 stop:2056 length:612 start_codon:yes stop_codon:yes gene_type:complete
MEEKTTDYLNNDRAIPGQDYVCLSFLSPESCLKNKELFSFYSFMKAQKGEDLDFETYSEQFTQYCDSHSVELQKNFTDQYGMNTNVRGLKVRGVYSTIEEAQFRAKALQQNDPNFNVFVAQVGFWLAWDPSPYNVGKQEYANDQLNELMKNYNDNQKQKDVFYEKHKTDRIAENVHENNQRKVHSELLESTDAWMEQKTNSSV